MTKQAFADWKSVATNVPSGLNKLFRKQLIEDEVTLQHLIMTFLHAYASGQITIHPNPILKDPRGPNLFKNGEIDEYRLLLKDASGTLINPIPMTEELV